MIGDGSLGCAQAQWNQVDRIAGNRLRWFGCDCNKPPGMHDTGRSEAFQRLIASALKVRLHCSYCSVARLSRLLASDWPRMLGFAFIEIAQIEVL